MLPIRTAFGSSYFISSQFSHLAINFNLKTNGQRSKKCVLWICPRRYRNRRLGDFLKVLDLTEGRATGIPTIRKSLIENGSPEAYFETDEERSFFETTLFVHAFFKNDKKVTENFGTISE